MKYTYKIVDDQYLEMGGEPHEYGETELVSFSSDIYMWRLFEGPVREILEKAEAKDRPYLANRLRCRIYDGKDLIFSLHVDKDGRFLGDDGGGWEAANDDMDINPAESAQNSSTKIKKDALPEILKALSALADSGASEKALEGAYDVLDSFPNESEYWAFTAKLHSAAGDGEDALHDIEVALEIDPSRSDYILSKFLILIQLGRSTEISALITAALPALNPEAKDHLLGFVEEGLRTELFSKFDLDPAVLGALILKRQRDENQKPSPKRKNEK